MEMPGPLQDIIAELTSESGTPPVARQRVLEWMRTDDIECMGAIYSLVTDHLDRIEPALQFGEYYPFVLAYLQRCLLENPQSEWAETRYGAGHNIIGWFVWSRRDPDQRTSTVAELKEWLAALYTAGDSEVRTCLVQATVEHLFENREVVEYFTDWQEHPVLSTAYSEAIEWVESGGRSPSWMLSERANRPLQPTSGGRQSG
jgi:hypothetical protein